MNFSDTIGLGVKFYFETHILDFFLSNGRQ